MRRGTSLLHLPGSVIRPARFVGRRGIVSRLAGPGAAGSVRVRTQRSPPPAMPSQPRWSPPDPQRPGPCPAGTPPTTTPTVDRGWLRRHPPRAVAGLPVGGGPVFPRRRRHGLGGSQQLPQQRCLLVRRRTVLAGPTTRQGPFAVPYGRPGQLLPGPGVRFPQFRNAGQWSLLTPRSLFFPNLLIFSPSFRLTSTAS